MAKNKTTVTTESEPEINNTVSSENDNALPICGIIMPIANTEGYPAGHWNDVYSIVCKAATSANFKPNLVSFDGDIGVIQKRIVQNIYSNPIVICDISSRNANVMFELGMRLAFDKPTIIIKDNKTPYSFDISPIEHLEYPADLRYQSINDFQDKLKNKIIETVRKSETDPEFTTFLKHFGTFKVAQLDEKEISSTEFLMAELNEIKNSIYMMHQATKVQPQGQIKFRPPIPYNGPSQYNIELTFSKSLDNIDATNLSNYIKKHGYNHNRIKLDNETLLINLDRAPKIDEQLELHSIVENYLEIPF
ncbi:hypothetical protein [Providencia sp.]|uniref:hypothetical protein n=1 Tax=Providencia sp. TaxID=589 RepID=UPI0035B43FC2